MKKKKSIQSHKNVAKRGEVQIDDMSWAERSEETLFFRCLELPPQERRAFIEFSTEGKPALRASLIDLLQAEEESEEFLDWLPPIDRAQPNLHEQLVEAVENSGDQIGRYKLIRLIGEGAWGTVWLAEQTEDIQRQVALKILKVGLDTKNYLIRFEAERQMLAMMDHPSIATILDAGTTQQGRPYLVMELVKGKPLLQYANDKRLNIRERIQLFVKICQALEHAHQKGIIHRDIKPSNVLVTEGDEGPLPKVIDFGVAKTNEFRVGEKTIFTSFHVFIGTPLYSSPEQLEFSSKEIDKRSDLYSLGLLLYELLTGKTPFGNETLTEEGLVGYRRVVRETYPPLPSVRFSKLSDAGQESISEARNTSPAKLVKQLKGDLDWVIMRCLEKDKSRRYQSAEAVAADLKALLECRPVSASAPSKLYRAGKFIQRNRLMLVTWTLVPTTVGFVLVSLLMIQNRSDPPIDPVSPFTTGLEDNNRSIAVLPLTNLSEKEEDSFLADSFHSELTTALSRIQDMKTITQNATVRYRDSDKPSRLIAAELGVISLLKGEIQRMGDRIRINVQLIDPFEDRNLWGESYIRQFTTSDLFDVQNQISRSIARELQAILTPEENRQLSQVPTQSMDALKAYFEGKEILMLDNKSRMPEAIELFSKAVEMDPKFTLAWVGLARSYIFIEPFWGVGGENEPERLEKLHAAAEMAFSLDSGLAEVQALQGYIHNLKGDRVNARAAYERAIEINPNYAEGYYELSNFLYRIVSYPDAADCEFLYGLDIRTLTPELLEGMMENSYMEIRVLLEKSIELEPTNPAYRQLLAYVYGQLDQPEEEIAQYKLALEFNPDKPFLNRMLGMILWYAGQLDEGIIYYRRAIALDPNRSQFSQNMSDVFFHLGDYEEASRWWLRVEPLVHPDLRFMYRARAMEHLGNREEAYRGYRERLSKLDIPYWAMYDHMRVYCDDFRAGRFEELRSMFYGRFPQLFESDVSIYDFQYSGTDVMMLFALVAQDLAPVLAALGEQEQAEHLMNEAWHHWRQHHQAWRKEFFMAVWLILRGQNQEAVQLLRDAFDAGMRDRYQFYDARLDPIRDDPSFVNVLERFEADMAQQRANVKRMEANGELAAIPKLEVPEDENLLVKFFPGMKGM